MSITFLLFALAAMGQNRHVPMEHSLVTPFQKDSPAIRASYGSRGFAIENTGLDIFTFRGISFPNGIRIPQARPTTIGPHKRYVITKATFDGHVKQSVARVGTSFLVLVDITGRNHRRLGVPVGIRVLSKPRHKISLQLFQYPAIRSRLYENQARPFRQSKLAKDLRGASSL